MVKLFADTASLSEIKYCFGREVHDGITTNPKIIEASGDLSTGFEGACKKILAAHPNVPVSLETDFGGLEIRTVHDEPARVKELLLQQAYKLASWGGNVVVKIPICEGGLEAVKELSRAGIKTNVTACMTPYQALEAVKCGATYVSLFANRMLDSHILELAGYTLGLILEGDEWKSVVKANQDLAETAWGLTLGEIAYVAQELDRGQTELIIGSIRSPADMQRIARAAPQVITVPHKIVQGLTDVPALKNQRREIIPENVNLGFSLRHPMTDYTLAEFERAAVAYRKSGAS